MEQKYYGENRRNFLTKVIPLAAMVCLGCARALALPIAS